MILIDSLNDEIGNKKRKISYVCFEVVINIQTNSFC